MASAAPSIIWPGRRALVPLGGEAWVYAVKNAAAALMALGIALSVGLPMPFWAMTTAFITASPLAAATRSKAIYRAIGTVIGAGVAVALVPMLVEAPLLLSLALALWVGGCLAISLLDRSPRAYVLMLAGYTATIVGFPAVSQPEAVFDLASARVTEIMLGIVCITLMHSLILPQSLAGRLGPKIDAWLGDAEDWLRDIVQRRDAPSARAIARDRARLAVDVLDCQLLASHLPYDTSRWREADRMVQALLVRMLLLVPLLSGLADRRSALAGASSNTVWTALLQESEAVRLGQIERMLEEARHIRAHLDDPDAALPQAEARLRIRLPGDPVHALASGAAATLAILGVCALWIITGWTDGAGAAVLVGVFCCLFAAMDNPVPMVLGFGVAIIAGVPLAGLWLFAILPHVEGFGPLCLAMLPVLLPAGAAMAHPTRGLLASAFLIGFCSALALQQTYSADLARFINSNLGQVIAVAAAAGVLSLMRGLAAGSAVARLIGRQWRDLAGLARATTPPDENAVLARASDQLALITQRLGTGDPNAIASLRMVRVAVNLAQVQQLRIGADRALHLACTRLLQSAARHFQRAAPGSPPPRPLLGHIDRALRLTLDGSPGKPTHGDLIGADRATARAALVALRRNLFPDAAAFVAELAP